MDPIDLNDRFSFHPANSKEKAIAHSNVREACADLATALNHLLPEGREKSLAMTNLEQVMFWSNASIARTK